MQSYHERKFIENVERNIQANLCIGECNKISGVLDLTFIFSTIKNSQTGPWQTVTVILLRM